MIPDIKLNKESAAMKIYLRVNPFCISVLKSSLNPKAPKMLTKNKVLISKQFVPTFSKLPETMPMIRVISPTIAYIFKRGHAFVLDD